MLSALDDRRVIDVAWVGAMLAVVGVATYLLTRYSTPSPEPAPRSLAVTQAESWIKENIPPGTPLTADPGVVGDLGAAGYTAAHPVAADGRGLQSWASDKFIVSTPSIRGVVSRALARAGGRTSAEAVATFGGEADGVVVRMIVHAGASTLVTRLASDAHDRASAGDALMINPRITADAASRTALDKGTLDLRAATMLALLAAQTDVHIVQIVTVHSEAVAGRPARELMLTLSDARALTATLRTLPAAYAPASVASSGTATVLEWGVGFAPMSILT